MADQNTHGEKMAKEGIDIPTDKPQTGGPGPTPGTAEGDRETVEKDLRHKERERQLKR